MSTAEPQDQVFDYDVAVSFAGEDKSYVEDVAKRLKESGVRLFYYEDVLAETWGRNLVDFLSEIYNRRARYALVFISKHYVAKKWTNLERQSAQDRALEQASPYILPVRLDDSELPGLHSTIAYVDARRLGIDELVQLVLQKLSGPEMSTPRLQNRSKFNGRVPRTASEVSDLVAERPAGWEYLLFGAILLDGNQKLDGKYRDHLIGYSRISENVVSDRVLPEEVRRRLDHVLSITAFFNRLLRPDVQDAAFGKPGEPGDPDRIRHIATRMCSVEEDLLDWAASVRATAVSSGEARRLIDALAHYADQSIEAIRGFISNYVQQADTLHEKIMTGEAVDLTITISFSIPEDVTREFDAAFAEFERKYG